MAPKNSYRRGPKLFSLARKKALRLDIPQYKGIKLAELICKIQEAEGHAPCYQQREKCDQADCCWQASCSAVMKKAEEMTH